MRTAPRAGWAGPRADLDGRRVLIVEDEVIVAFSLECAIGDAGGAIVGPAHSLAEAQQLIDEAIDVAILDINLNGEPVWPVAEALRERGIPYVLASANCNDIDLPDAAVAAVPCFDKPVPLPRLIAAVAELAND